MMRRLTVSIAIMLATAAQAAEPIDLEVLYVGAAGTERAHAFEALLTQHFTTARVVNRDDFQATDIGDADVVLLDWAQRDTDIMSRAAPEHPLGSRESWSTPIVMLGSAGLLTAKAWQTNGSYG